MDLSLVTRLRLGVSSCLLGEAVRYDGSDEHDHWVADRFGPMVEWVRVCPEAEAGLGIPRPKIQLETADGSVRVREVDASTDHTDRLQGWADERLGDLDLGTLDGYVFKARSPSCGVNGVDVFDDGNAVDRARGFFAERLLAVDPHLPTCDEDDVQVPERRRHFLERAQARSRWRQRIATLPSDEVSRGAAVADLLERHALLLVCRERTPIAFDRCGADNAALRATGQLLAECMHAEPTVAGHVRALATLFDRMTGVTAHERTGLGVLIDQVERGETDVEVARQLARGLVLRAGDAWSRRQHYLDPVPVAGS